MKILIVVLFCAATISSSNGLQATFSANAGSATGGGILSESEVLSSTLGNVALPNTDLAQSVITGLVHVPVDLIQNGISSLTAGSLPSNLGNIGSFPTGLAQTGTVIYTTAGQPLVMVQNAGYGAVGSLSTTTGNVLSSPQTLPGGGILSVPTGPVQNLDNPSGLIPLVIQIPTKVLSAVTDQSGLASSLTNLGSVANPNGPVQLLTGSGGGLNFLSPNSGSGSINAGGTYGIYGYNTNTGYNVYYPPPTGNVIG